MAVVRIPATRKYGQWNSHDERMWACARGVSQYFNLINCTEATFVFSTERPKRDEDYHTLERIGTIREGWYRYRLIEVSNYYYGASLLSYSSRQLVEAFKKRGVNAVESRILYVWVLV